LSARAKDIRPALLYWYERLGGPEARGGDAAREERNAMVAGEGDPKELFGLRLAHVGINTDSVEEAERIAAQFQALMGLEPKHLAPISVFADDYVEIMNNGGRGTLGHIGFHVDDVEAAEPWFEARGFKVNESSRYKLPGEDKTYLVYFEDEIGGFAIHLTRG
jgi:2-dehydro-3-deoxyphosphogluconate aldolase/(4S)-4-hydroxy-2-oxoglutarate aldolase